MPEPKLPKLTLERLKEALHYDPDTGILTWKVRNSNRTSIGEEITARNSCKYPYIVLCLDRERLYAHRVAWFYMTGEWPPSRVDHINGDRSDNRWINLRLATQQENVRNAARRSDNKSGFKGVCFDKARNKWKAQLKRNQRYLGRFDTPEEAYAAYTEAAKQEFGEFFRGA